MSAKVGLLEHFRKLADFRGREDRASFWPYAALVLAIVMVAGALVTLPMMARLMEVAPQFGSNSPGPLAPVLPAGFLAVYLALTVGLAVLLYAAAVFRRLHDRGRSGAWGLMPLPFLAYISVRSVLLFGSLSRGADPDPTLLVSIAAAQILYWVALLALVVLLAGPSDPGPNRFDRAD